MLYKSVASRGLARNESPCGSGFRALTVASVLALACAAAVAPASAEGLLDRRGSVKDVVDVAPGCANFHGFYQGLHIGTGFHDWSWNDRDAWADDFSGSVGSTDTNVIGGIQAGFNWQKGCTVFGLEADWSWAGFGNSKVHTAEDEDDDELLTVSSQIEGFGTLRTRAGVVVDNLLLYVTGGLAFADIERRATLENDNDDEERETFNSSDTRLGWTAGFGAEWAFTDRISIKSEALWFRFEEDGTTHLREEDEERKRFDNQDSVWVGRIGLNIKLGYDSPLDPRWLP
jgi:outer membrane immunogenic protein